MSWFTATDPRPSKAIVGSDDLSTNLERKVLGKDTPLVGSYCLCTHLERSGHRYVYNPTLCQYFPSFSIVMAIVGSGYHCTNLQRSVQG